MSKSYKNDWIKALLIFILIISIAILIKSFLILEKISKIKKKKKKQKKKKTEGFDLINNIKKGIIKVLVLYQLLK